MPKFKTDDVFKFEDMEFAVMSVEDEGYVVRRIDSDDPLEGQMDRTFVFDDEPDMHLVNEKYDDDDFDEDWHRALKEF